MRPCPRCKQQVPENAKVCPSCGTRFAAAPQPAQKAPEPAAPSPVGAKTTFGIASPIIKPVAAKPAAPAAPKEPVQAAPEPEPPSPVPAKTAFGFASPVARPQTAPPQKAAWGGAKPQAKPAAPETPVLDRLKEEAAPAPTPAVPTKTAFGAGMAVQPVARVTPAPPSEPEPEPAPSEPGPVLPKTMFGVGVAAPIATAPPFPAMEQPRPVPTPEPTPQPVAHTPQPTPSSSARTEFGGAAVEKAPAKVAPAAASGPLEPPSSEERGLLGPDNDLPREPAAVPGFEGQMPPAPANPVGLLGYFFGVLKARVAFITEARRLEAEIKRWQQRQDYLLSTLGLRALTAAPSLPEVAQAQGQIVALQNQIKETSQKQQAAIGERGAKLKAFEEREATLGREVAEKEGAYNTLHDQFSQVDKARKALQKKASEPLASEQIKAELAQTENTHFDLRSRSEQARQAMAAAKGQLDAVVKEKGQMLKDVSAQMKASEAQLSALRAELLKLTAPVGQAALLQGAPVAQPFRTEIDAINAGINARQEASQRYRAQLTQIDKPKFLQGAGAFGGVLVVLLIVLFLLRP